MVAAAESDGARFPCALVTGFEAFGPDAVNPGWMAAQALHGRVVGGHRLVGAQLPTAFDHATEELRTH